MQHTGLSFVRELQKFVWKVPSRRWLARLRKYAATRQNYDRYGIEPGNYSDTSVPNQGWAYSICALALLICLSLA